MVWDIANYGLQIYIISIDLIEIVYKWAHISCEFLALLYFDNSWRSKIDSLWPSTLICFNILSTIYHSDMDIYDNIWESKRAVLCIAVFMQITRLLQGWCGMHFYVVLFVGPSWTPSCNIPCELLYSTGAQVQYFSIRSCLVPTFGCVWWKYGE